MDVIADANSIFSFLIKEGKSAEILINFAFDFYTPEFLFEEIKEHKEEVLKKTKRSEKEFDNLMNGIRDIINVCNEEEFKEYLKEAEEISPDKDDIPYFALALKLRCGIWSNDKRMKDQNKIRIYSTEELVRLIES